ncbi:MAG: hypothetical protein R3189_04255 [Thiomicrorhabdus chilensis]|uniref:hypothetical protein n=1 Tax=Thiomicrorhabdus chilensis TaxID=63656 RepID=UPI00299DF209|nr:hypothetical protein [Thiomicrorhabdus chilensis]MDX1347446.1 hypothetical protein [Thiomicrorhabdus chilensis]
MMGHASEDTATHSYGKARSGRGGFRVRPYADDVLEVEALAEQKQERRGFLLRR